MSVDLMEHAASLLRTLLNCRSGYLGRDGEKPRQAGNRNELLPNSVLCCVCHYAERYGCIRRSILRQGAMYRHRFEKVFGSGDYPSRT